MVSYEDQCFVQGSGWSLFPRLHKVSAQQDGRVPDGRDAQDPTGGTGAADKDPKAGIGPFLPPESD